jgi:hypothetical protein
VFTKPGRYASEILVTDSDIGLHPPALGLTLLSPWPWGLKLEDQSFVFALDTKPSTMHPRNLRTLHVPPPNTIPLPTTYVGRVMSSGLACLSLPCIFRQCIFIFAPRFASDVEFSILPCFDSISSQLLCYEKDQSNFRNEARNLE